MPKGVVFTLVAVVASAAHGQDRGLDARVALVELQPAGNRPAAAATRSRAALRAAASGKAREAGQRAGELERQLARASAERPPAPAARLEQSARTARLREAYLRARVEQMMSRALSEGRALPYTEILGFLDREARAGGDRAQLRGLRRLFEQAQQR